MMADRRRDEGAARRGPRRLDRVLDGVVEASSPGTLLADVQIAWPGLVGDAVAARATPVAERDGRLTIACESGPWAQELEMMSEMLLTRIAGAVGEARVATLRFTADLSRHRQPPRP